MPPSTRPLAEQLLARAFPPSTAHDLFLNKVRHKPLALCPTPANNNNTNNNDNNARTARRLKRQQHCTRPAATKPRPLSARARRQLRAHAAPLTAGARAPYAAYVPLARLWHAYIRELLGVRADSAAAAEEEAGEEGNGSAKPKPKAWAGPVAASRLCSADFHGAEVLVVQARCVARVGVQGIVVRDSRAAFVVVTRAGDVKCKL
ncbi:MAG: hypothetical protein M1829_004932 [Trizodia sp. TS-e1964]|nr:MAG: hypothetical protein M1829_004932 [Trizodia sp. TS-e1964]